MSYRNIQAELEVCCQSLMTLIESVRVLGPTEKLPFACTSTIDQSDNGKHLGIGIFCSNIGRLIRLD